MTTAAAWDTVSRRASRAAASRVSMTAMSLTATTISPLLSITDKYVAVGAVWDQTLSARVDSCRYCLVVQPCAVVIAA